MDQVLFFADYALTTLFGVVLSFAFCGLRFGRRNCWLLLLGAGICGVGQLLSYVFFGEDWTRKLYPLLVHIPLGVYFLGVFKRRVPSVVASIALAYLCCQPAKWFGVLAEALHCGMTAVRCIRILVMIAVAVIAVRYLADYISELFGQDARSVFVFSIVPLVYYIFDYTVNVYTDLWVENRMLMSEFLSFFLCVIFVVFCVVYYKACQKTTDAQRIAQIAQITAQQQEKEIAAIRKSNMETSLLRHDMRLLLSNLAVSIDQNDKETALKMISGFVSQVEAAAVRRYSGNDTLNYILTNYESKCREKKTAFSVTVEIADLRVDEMLFASILSNALDNALNAQEQLPEEKRQIRLMLKNSDGKLLLSVKNPFREAPVFADGLPVSDRPGHGYGAKSIRYMTHKLGGKCRFSIQEGMFVLRIVL